MYLATDFAIRYPAFRATVGLRSFNIHHQTVAVLGPGMRHVPQLGLGALTLLKEPELRIGGACMRGAATALPIEVGIVVATGEQIRSAAVLPDKTLVTRAGVDQSAGNAEVLVADKVLRFGQVQDAIEEFAGKTCAQQTIQVDAEHVVHGKTDEPAESRVVVEQLHELPLTTHAVSCHFSRDRSAILGASVRKIGDGSAFGGPGRPAAAVARYSASTPPRLHITGRPSKAPHLSLTKHPALGLPARTSARARCRIASLADVGSARKTTVHTRDGEFLTNLLIFNRRMAMSISNEQIGTVSTRMFFTKLRGGGQIPARVAWRQIGLAWMGGCLAIGVVAYLAAISHTALILGSFGATCVLAFGFPDSPFSQPRNIIAGHFLSSLVGLCFLTVLGNEWWSVALAVGTAIAVMQMTRTVHPPAGSNPVIVMLATPGWNFLLTPTLIGALILALVATVFNNLPKDRAYPKYW